MVIIQTESCTILKPNFNKDENNTELILDFHKDFTEKYSNFKNVNLILDFSESINLDLKEILLFSQSNNVHKRKNNSFVLVGNGINFDQIPDDMIVVPTLQEAKDIIELENIERDLGI
jgi:hypothetical protein